MSIGLTAYELAQIRRDISGLLPDTCDILSVTYASDGQGGQTETWGTVTGGSAVACRFDYRAGRENLTNAALMPYSSGIVSLAYDETLTTANRLKFDANTYGIISVNTDQSWIGVTRVVVEIVK